jgi:polyisoprenoid-binding protein YceI
LALSREKTMRCDLLPRTDGLAMARGILLSLLALLAMGVAARAQVPVFEITPQGSSIKFSVNASVSVKGTFDQWNATLKFTSDDPGTGVLDIKIPAASVDTGSGLKNSKLKGEDFFDVEHNPWITFHSTKIVQTGPSAFEVDGDFTIRGVTKQEKLVLTVSGVGTGAGDITGTMAFDRKDYGMNGSIPLVRIADRVEVTVNLHARRTSGPALALKK